MAIDILTIISYSSKIMQWLISKILATGIPLIEWQIAGILIIIFIILIVAIIRFITSTIKWAFVAVLIWFIVGFFIPQ